MPLLLLTDPMIFPFLVYLRNSSEKSKVSSVKSHPIINIDRAYYQDLADCNANSVQCLSETHHFLWQ